jgi:molybdopterin molybdotransferase
MSNQCLSSSQSSCYYPARSNMPELFQVLTPPEALSKLNAHLKPIGRTETVSTQGALRRVAAEDIRAPEELPAFARSSMDGYAVRAEDTYGASEGLPAYLNVVGEVPMGHLSPIKLSTGEAALIHTGGPIPEGANAVVMVENTQEIDESSIEVVKAVAAGENVIQIGEDVHEGDLLLPQGNLIRPQDIGGFFALGITRLTVYERPKVAIISTGDEVVLPEDKPAPGQVRNVNTYTISAMTQEIGGVPLPLGIIPDNYEALRGAVEKGLKEADAVVVTAGSSVSTRDLTAQVINSLGEPGVLVHGVSLRPGKPTILALAGSKPVFGLAGNPGSAIVTFDLFVAPTIYRLSGAKSAPARPTCNARITHNIASATGREDYVPVKLSEKDGELWAEPIFGKSNLIFTLVRSDGMAQVPLNREGVEAGETVVVKLF